MRRLLFVLAAFVWAPSVAGQLVADMIDAPVAVTVPVLQVDGAARVIAIESSGALSPFTGIALQGTATGDSLHGQVRFESAVGAGWSAWAPLYIVRSYTDAAFLAAYRSDEVHTALRFELRFELSAKGTVEIIQAGTFLDEAPSPPPDAAPRGGQASDYKIMAPDLHDRAEWGAEPFRGTPQPLAQPDYLRMTLHHTAGFAAVTLTEGLEQVKRIQDFHQNGRGWSDIGYHYLMDQEGRLYQGRPWLNPSAPFDQGPPLALGAHVGGNNTGNIGVSLMGCYHPPEGSDCQDEMTVAAVDSLVASYAYLSERYGVNPDALRGHRDFSSTACPGDNNYGMLDSFREDIADLLITGNAALGTAVLSAIADTSGVVALRWRFLTDLGIDTFTIWRGGPGGRSPIVVRRGAVDGTWVDAAVKRPGALTYSLVARGSHRREQILSTATVEVRGHAAIHLAHSFPNPASASTTIRYFLAQAGIVTLEVFDAAGRRVASLVEAYRDKDLWYSVVLNTRGLAPGTYYYQLRVEGFADTIYQAAVPLVVAR